MCKQSSPVSRAPVVAMKTRPWRTWKAQIIPLPGTGTEAQEAQVLELQGVMSEKKDQALETAVLMAVERRCLSFVLFGVVARSIFRRTSGWH
jgi:hypothetical protein